MKYCSNCGIEISPGATYCISCGNYLKKTDFVVTTNYIKFCGSCGEELNDQNYCSSCGSVGYTNLLSSTEPKNIIPSVPSVLSINMPNINMPNIKDIKDIKFNTNKAHDIANKSTKIVHDKLSKIIETLKDNSKENNFLTNALMFTAILNILIIVFGIFASYNFYPNLDNFYGFKSEIKNIVINYALMYGLRLKFLFYSDTNFNIGFLNNVPAVFLVFNFIFVFIAAKILGLLSNCNLRYIIKTSLLNSTFTSLLIYFSKSNYNYKKGLALLQINADAYFSFGSEFLYMFLKIFIITLLSLCIIKYFYKLKFVFKTFFGMLAYAIMPTLIMFFVTASNTKNIKNIFDGFYYFVMILYNTLITFLTGKLFIGSISSNEINTSLTLSPFSNTSLLIRFLILIGFLYFIFLIFIRVYNHLKYDSKTFINSIIFILKFSICMSFIFYILSSMAYNNLTFDITTSDKTDLLQKLSLPSNIDDTIKINILNQNNFYIFIRSFIIFISTSFIAFIATWFNLEKFLPRNSFNLFLKVYYSALSVALVFIFLNLNSIIVSLQNYTHDFYTNVKTIDVQLKDYKLDNFYNSISNFKK